MRKKKNGRELLSESLGIVRAVIRNNYPRASTRRIRKVGSDVFALFTGKFRGYQGCDTNYHDLEHTLQIVPPFVQMIDGWNRSEETPKISYRFFELGVIACLLHDTGYIKKEGDNDGTGGKYTFTHIGRSVNFARKYLSSDALGIDGDDIDSVANMICCTGLIDSVADFSCDEERICGYALGIADLMGQLAAKDYLGKLVHLYHEFKEAYDFEGIDELRARNVLVYDSCDDLIRSTPLFFRSIVKKKFREMGSLDQYIKYHHPKKVRHYETAIRKNLEQIEQKTQGTNAGKRHR